MTERIKLYDVNGALVDIEVYDELAEATLTEYDSALMDDIDMME